MKKIYFGLSLLMCMFLSGCSDNDEPKTQELSKIYLGNDLTLTLNEIEVKTRSVKFITSDLVKGEIELINLIPGESNLKIVNVAIQQDGKDNNIYNLTGESTNADRTITVSGTVGNGLKLDVVYKGVSPLINHWKLASSSSIQFNIEPSSPDAKANMFGIMWAKEVPVANGTSSGFDRRLPNILVIVMNMMVKLDFDIQESSDFIVHWTPGAMKLFEEGQTAPGLLRQNPADGRLYLSVDVAQVLPGLLSGDILEGGITGEIDIQQILALVQQLNQGLPIGTILDEKGGLSLVLPREVLLPYFKLLLPMLQGILMEAEIPTIGFGINNESLTNLVGEIVRLMEESPKFDIIINLQPVS